jgi:peptide/nickel transport system substrate-binding protein
MERAAYYSEYGEKKLRGVLYTGQRGVRQRGHAAGDRTSSVAAGTCTAASRHRRAVRRAGERDEHACAPAGARPDPADVHERSMFIPVMETAFLNGVGPRVENHGLNVIPGFAYSAPYEDLTLRKK